DDGARGEVEAPRQYHHRLAHRGERQGGSARRDKARIEVAEPVRAEGIENGKDQDEGADRDEETAMPPQVRPSEPPARLQCRRGHDATVWRSIVGASGWPSRGFRWPDLRRH